VTRVTVRMGVRRLRGRRLFWSGTVRSLKVPLRTESAVSTQEERSAGDWWHLERSTGRDVHAGLQVQGLRKRKEKKNGEVIKMDSIHLELRYFIGRGWNGRVHFECWCLLESDLIEALHSMSFERLGWLHHEIAVPSRTAVERFSFGTTQGSNAIMRG
jgi:hypothetical protein